MSGYSTYTHWQRIEAQAKTLGFRLGNPSSHSGWNSHEGDMVTLYPAIEALPIFNRDADIYTGTFAQIEVFLTGWVRARQYDSILGAVDDTRRKKYEDRELARQAEQRKREEQATLMKVLKATDEENQGKKK